MMQSKTTLHRWADQGFRALVFACFFGSIPAQGSDLSAQAEQIANLRAEVASLTEEVSTREEAHRMRLRSLETQRADLELQIRRADAQRDALAEALAELEAENKDLENRVLELRNGVEVVEKRASEHKAMADKKRKDEIDFLKYQGQHLDQFLRQLGPAAK